LHQTPRRQVIGESWDIVDRHEAQCGSKAAHCGKTNREIMESPAPPSL
jgi:hypothetical protein